MRLKTGEYFIQEVFHSLRRNNWMTFASIGTVAVSLFVLGVFLILVLNMNRLVGMLESQVQISVYLEDHLTDREKRQIGYDIESLQGIDTVTYVDREEAKARLAERLGDQKYLLDALSEDNPLPDAFEVTVTTPSVVESAAEAIDSLQGVEEAKYGQDVVEHLFDITRLMRIFGFVLMGLLGGATLFIISNTIRLTVFARRREIAIMKYVGATDWFIRWPFIIEGLVLGVVAGGIAFGLEWLIYNQLTGVIYANLPQFTIYDFHELMWYVLGVFGGAGVIVGVGGSSLTIRRFMNV